MNLLKCVRAAVLVSSLGLGASAIQAQETNEVEQLKRQLQQMRDDFERTQREQRQQIEALTQKLDAVQKQQEAEAEKKKLETDLAKDPAPTSSTTSTPAPAPPTWSPTSPIRIGSGGTYADLGLVATFAVGGSTASDIEGGTQLGGHDPHQNGFTVQGVELNLQGAVDPYFRANANIAFLLDQNGETGVELEEAWMETVSLPWNLQVRAGQILTEFGRINTQHPHAWAFVDVPLVNGRLMGEDGLRNPGARISWLAPTPFYSELFFSVQNSGGGTAHSFDSGHGGAGYLGRLDSNTGVNNLGDMLFTTRYAASFDLSDTQTLLAGASAAFGPNSSGSDADTQIYGVDAYWKWKPANAHAGFPFLSWQSEVMLRRYLADASRSLDLTGDSVPDFVPRETLTDWGFYSQLLYGFRQGWVAGLRGDYVTHSGLGAYEVTYGADLDRATRWRISPNLTWYPSEFSKIRLQYNYDNRGVLAQSTTPGGRVISGLHSVADHSVWLQFEFLLGAHAAHKF